MKPRIHLDHFHVYVDTDAPITCRECQWYVATMLCVRCGRAVCDECAGKRVAA